MDKKIILSMVDHTLLSQTATLSQIKTICDDAIKYGCASVCIPASYVKFASEYAPEALKICTVIGFPLGYSTTGAKCFEASNAIENGADEIDMVANITLIKEGMFDQVLEEIRSVKKAIGNHILKVIIETCLLTEDEKIKMCNIVSESGADYIKTSTGFSTGGATREDIKLFAENIYGDLKIKAAGGIKSFDDARAFIELGASRLGTSSLVKIIKNEQLGEY